MYMKWFNIQTAIKNGQCSADKELFGIASTVISIQK